MWRKREREKERGELKEKFRESEIVMGHENNVRPLTYRMHNNHKTYCIFCVSCLDVITLLSAFSALINSHEKGLYAKCLALGTCLGGFKGDG